MPIFSDNDYWLVAETVAELKAQARKMQLDVFPVVDASMACRRLVELKAKHVTQ